MNVTESLITIDAEPLVAFDPDQSPEAEQLVASVDDQFNVTVPPRRTDDGLAVRLSVGTITTGGGGSFTVTVTVGGNTAYLTEVHQAGIFTLKGMDAEQLHRTQHVFCLRFLHPYAIAAILDLITKGGFPQFLMPPVNFGDRYTERYENSEKTSKPEDS